MIDEILDSIIQNKTLVSLSFGIGLGYGLSQVLKDVNWSYQFNKCKRVLYEHLGGFSGRYRLKIMDKDREVTHVWYEHFPALPLPADGSRLEVVSGCFVSGPVKADFPVIKVEPRKGTRMPVVRVDWNHRKVLN